MIMYANEQTNLVRHNFKNRSAAYFEKRPKVDERKGLKAQLHKIYLKFVVTIYHVLGKLFLPSVKLPTSKFSNTCYIVNTNFK